MKVTFELKSIMNIYKTRKYVLALALLLTGGIVKAQVTIDGDVYGGGNLGEVRDNATVNMRGGTLKSCLYGGGKGSIDNVESGLVKGNTKVDVKGGLVEHSLYGGGELGSVGTFTEFYNVATGAHVAGEPKTCDRNTGKTEVLISGGQVGIDEAVMPDVGSTAYEDDMGYVFCGSRGEADTLKHPSANLFAVVKETHLKISGSALITASAYGGSENGLVMGDTHVEIAGGQIGTGYDRTTQLHDGRYTETQWNTVIQKIKNGTFTEADASGFHECDHWPYGDGNGHYYTYDIYAEEEGYDSHGGALNATDGHTFYGNVFGGGSGYYPFWDEENTRAVWRRSAGRVWGNTQVDITGGHILTSIYGGNEMTDVMGKCTVNMTGGTLGVPRTIQDINAHPVTCYLFGGGKGDQRDLFNTWTNVQEVEVNIGGSAFFFGSVFGGGEDGHVLGDIVMNINEESTDAAHIGTWGYSYVDGNVFGGGRGFSGEGITCGSVGGDITVNINGGNILGSIYGGGRMASAGIGFALELDPIIGYFQPDIPDDPETPEDESETHGHVTINISGGTIGNDYESKLHLGNPDLEGGRTHGGNVFGGSMGRLTKLDGSINPKWPILGQVKTTEINIEGDNTIIKGNVYGGGEFGLVLDNTEVNVRGGTIWRNVYGGGYGSNDNTTITDIQTGQAGVTFRYTPMAFAGVVSKKTFVNISGGWVKKNVYGGGEMASVGLIDYRLNNAGTDFENITKHDNEASSFALSWPYDYQYFTGFDGNTHVEITGGRIGITGKDFMGPWNASGTPLVIPEGGTEYVAYDGSDAHKKALKAARQDNGDVFGGGHGIAGDRYDLAFCANANNTVVSVDITSDANPTTYKPNDWVYGFLPKANDWTNYGTLACIAGSVYGGAENGHVLNTANLTLDKGLIGHAIYGGGKGKDTYTVSLLNLGSTTEYHNAEIYSLTAGKVYGSTSVTMNGGYVMRNVYGGGNMASVGKGNYAGGSDDYSTAGYGEKVANLWTGGEDSDAWHFMNSGKATVNIVGGTVGTAGGEKDDLPTGNVFGGCRGEAAPNIPNTPRYQYAPSFFSGYVNMTDVTIGRLAEGTEGQEGYVAASGPLIYGSVYGGGQDGHVRRSTNVTVNYGEIGLAYNADNIANVGTEDENGNTVTSTHFKWLLRGNVTGSGSGIGKYEYDLPDSDPTLNYDGIINENHTFTYTYNGRTIRLSEKDYSNSSGSVTDSTSVVINGGTIYRNIYGGGSLATVGPPYIPGTINPNEELGKPSHWSKNIVEVKSGTVGESAGVVEGYGGHVFGAGRGVETVDIEKFSTSVQTQVTIGSETTHDALVYGNVYGGGEVGQVSDDTEANVVSGQVGTIDYTDANNDGTFDGVTHTTGGKVFGGGKGLASVVEAARVKGNSNVNIRGGHVLFNVYGGGEMASVGLREQYTYTTGEGNEQTEHTDYRPKRDDHNQPTGLAKVTVTGGQVGPAPREGEGYNIPIGLNGVDGYVFGGGKGIANDYITDPAHPYSGSYHSFADVNNTEVTVNIPASADANTNRIWGSIFGGAEDGHVLGNAHTYYISGLMGTTGTTSYDGNIFGGGRNYSKANYNAGRVRGNITVEMKGGQIYGSIFGGGRLALTGVDLYGNIIPDEEGENGQKFGNVKVKVTGGKVGNEALIENFTTYSMGDVFGGGKGDKTGIVAAPGTHHPKASVLLVSMTKNTEVEISEVNPDVPTRIYGSVYGGGEMANVGQYTWDLVPNQEPQNIALKDGTGVAKVTVSGGIIGIDNMSLSSDDIHVDANFNPTRNMDIGHVFGAGEGIVDDPDRLDDNNQPLYPQVSIVEGGQTIQLSLFNLMNTVGETQVTVSGDAFVKGSVYGGGLNGHVERDAKVYIQGGQIGFGENADGTDKPKYDNDLFVNPLQEGGITTSLAGCPHWDLGDDSGAIIPYDPVLIYQENPPRDGTSWYGNVYGGGSGLFPYVVKNTSNNLWESHWNSYSGQVKGNTRVEISGGHILTNVYGGCEITNVGSYGYDNTQGVTNISGEGKGKATIVMSGGSIGVPRTAEQIEQFPLSGDLFGAGKGDPRTAFNTWTNVANTDITITGGFVYGSVFGGGEDGHVIENTKILVSKAEGSDLVIGSHGNTGLEGNVFGGGQGDVPEALTAGGLGGNTLVEVKDGNVLGSVYGGGSTGSVGIRFVPAGHQQYGLVQDGENHGYTTVNISGGTIGHVDNTGRIGGNVYGGCKGLAGPPGSIFQKMAKVKETRVNISQANGKQTFIMGSVFGAGEDGHVTKDTHVAVSGGQIGGDRYYAGDATPHLCANEFHGNVYGGGRGLTTYTDNNGNPQYSITAGKVDGNTNVSITGGRVCRDVYGGGNISSVGDPNEMPDAQGNYHTGLATVMVSGGKIGIGSGEYDNDYASGHVFGSGHGKAGTLYADKSFVKNTFVNIKENAIVYGSVFGSGEDGHVRKNTHVLVEGGTIGVTGDTGYEGNVYGGGRGLDRDMTTHQFSPTAGKTEGNTLVEVVGGWVKGSVFGGGRLASVGNPAEEPDAQGNYHTGLAKVVIGDDSGTKTATIGTTHEAQTSVEFGGNVYGGGKGQAGATYRDLTFVKNTSVTIRKGAAVHGSVFGGGEDGHVRQTSTVNVTGGIIGDDESTCANKYHGNVYGAGRGIDNTGQGEGGYSWTAGRVNWSATVNISGGHIYRNVYGGGNLASVGRVKRDENYNLVLLPNGDMNPLDKKDRPMYNNDGSLNDQFDPALLTGWAHVNITGGTIGSDADIDDFHGNVFGSSHGMAGEDFKNLAYVHNAEVRVSVADSENPTLIKGSVFGGGEDGHVTINTKVTVNGGQIGAKDNDEYKGNVYGGGRGIDIDSEGQLSSTAGMVKGHTRVYVNGGLVKNSVYGGGNKSVVRAEKVVNINGGTVEQDVYGGCNAVPVGRQHIGLKTVNVRNGLIKGNVYGCSHNSTDGNAEVTPTTDNPSWTAFVNISGGEIGGNTDKGNVHGAGFEGIVKGSVCVNVGKDAIVKQVNNVNQPRIAANTFYNDCGGDEPGLTSGQTAIEPTVGKLIIRGSVFGGSDYFGSTQSTNWNNFDITGYSNLYIDGTGYNTTSNSESTADYMAIGGGLFGSGTHCESGALGRHILLKGYGTRDSESELTQATRTLKTIQRGGIVLLDNANVNLSGADDISGRADATKDYSVMKVDAGLYVTNASGLVIGNKAVGETPAAPAYMDSIKLVKSLYLKDGNSSYDQITNFDNSKWEVIGIKDDDNTLYRLADNTQTALSRSEENVIIFNDISKLWVRYTHRTTNLYGELQGFFRMRGDSYQPRGMESFAYARPKITDEYTTNDNTADGGFLSYNNSYNFFTDNGQLYTKTKQHPYTNVLSFAKGDRVDYREWVIQEREGIWYVDGRSNGWGSDAYSKTVGAGRFPDKPKKTIFGEVTYNSGTNPTGNRGGIVTEVLSEGNLSYLNYVYKTDRIYVVGELSAEDEGILRDSIGAAPEYTHYPLKLYRYPGGHQMSNGEVDYGTAQQVSWGVPNGSHAGPGANYGAMANVQANKSLAMQGVMMDGLYGFTEEEVALHQIPTATALPDENFPVENIFDATKVSKPLIVTHGGSTLTLQDSTALMRGYNSTDAASAWYNNVDYAVPSGTYHGGALFVDSLATVNVSGMVTITGNKQKNGDGVVDCNVYLPTFSKSLRIIGELAATTVATTKIGVTSPKRNKAPWYYDNTFSPVAEATKSNWAASAWEHCNFLDDQGWFFVNGNKTSDTPSPRTTYYNAAGTKNRDNKTLYFGWTWASVVRTAPTGYSATAIDSPEELAWLITSVPDGSMKQTADVDMKQYVWVPIGDEDTPFAGHYDGQGHLIKNLYIEYIGTGDLRYERTDYGLFGHVNEGTVDRTFVVSGEYQPFVSDLNGNTGKNIGGLVGCMEGSSTVSNSEAAVMILALNPNDHVTGNVIGGLVAKMNGGEIHSSMAMPNLYIGDFYKGTLGGLVGNATGGNIYNSFANGTFDISSSNSDVVAGGLLGINDGAMVMNCYVNWHDGSTSLTSTNFGSLAASNTTANTIVRCYAKDNATVSFAVSGGVDATCKLYSPVYSADMLGYMYHDNKIEGDTAMFIRLNDWVDRTNGSGHKYARWARPGLAYYEMVGENSVLKTPINGDLPVLLISNYDAMGTIGAGDFRTMGTYAGSEVLQYGGPIRDERQIDSALVRTKAAEADDYLFVYGDITEKIKVESGKTITQNKISVNEDVAIMDAGALSDYDNTYVGVTFDNSFGAATSTPGINYGLNGLGMGGYPLPRDWHMFSSPLQNAPLGFNYGTGNVASGPYNNPWMSWDDEFNWLQSGGSTNVRYWMYGWDNSLSQSVSGTTVNLSTWRDGYFPSEATTFGTGLISGSDEDGCFPYGMDLYTWTEPDYHWINFKRNGPNHWHSDGEHEHINYKPYGEVTSQYPANVNENDLIVGRGYMASVATETFMQSHGRLNANDMEEILLTNTDGSKLQGWNLVGNPFHSYLDFNKVGDPDGPNKDVLNVHEDEGAFYVVYNADKYNNGDANTAFRYYPVNGSVGGDYANQFLHPHQGFYVSAKERGNLKFTKEMLVDRTTVGDANQLRDERPSYPLVNLYLSSDQGCADVTVIEFERPEWGGARKIKELRVGDGLFYAHHGDTKYAALFAQMGIDRVPLWFEAKEDDIFTMKWNLANADFHSMYLIDNIAGVQYDMLRNNTYSFEGHKGDYPSRFLIVFSLTDVDEHLEGNGFVFFDGSQWMVTGEGDLEFIDALGQVLVRTQVHGGQSRVGVPDVAPGVYLFRLTNSEGTRVQKVIVKR